MFSVRPTFFSLTFLPELRRVLTGENVVSDPVTDGSSLLILPGENRSHIFIYKNIKKSTCPPSWLDQLVLAARVYRHWETGYEIGENFPEATKMSVKKFLSTMLLSNE